MRPMALARSTAIAGSIDCVSVEPELDLLRKSHVAPAVVRRREEDAAVVRRAQAAARGTVFLDQEDVLRCRPAVDAPGDVRLTAQKSIPSAASGAGRPDGRRPVGSQRHIRSRERRRDVAILGDDRGGHRRVGVTAMAAFNCGPVPDTTVCSVESTPAPQRRGRQEQRGGCPDDEHEHVRSSSHQEQGAGSGKHDTPLQ